METITVGLEFLHTLRTISMKPLKYIGNSIRHGGVAISVFVCTWLFLTKWPPDWFTAYILSTDTLFRMRFLFMDWILFIVIVASGVWWLPAWTWYLKARQSELRDVEIKLGDLQAMLHDKGEEIMSKAIDVKTALSKLGFGLGSATNEVLREEVRRNLRMGNR